jgi:hypothetical protein
MGNGQGGDLEGTDLQRVAGTELVQRLRYNAAAAATLVAQHGQCETRAVDGHTQLRPQQGQGTEMILVGMREHDSRQAVAPCGDERRVRHLDPRATGLRALEGDTAIDHQPPARVAEQVEVHADFAAAAEGEEQQLTIPRRHCAAPGWQTGHQ